MNRDHIPVYVTRKAGPDDVCGIYRVAAWMPAIAIRLVLANLICWGILGLLGAAIIAVDVVT